MPSYKSAIEWIAYEDDTEFVKDDEPTLSVTATMVADLWHKDHAQVVKDIKAALARMRKFHGSNFVK